jgi:hypothetical protein
MGFSMMTLNTHVLNTAPKALVSRVTPLTSATQQVVMSVSIAGLTGYLASRANADSNEFVHADSLHHLSQAFGDTCFTIAIIAVIGLLFSLTLRKPKNHEEEEVQN